MCTQKRRGSDAWKKLERDSRGRWISKKKSDRLKKKKVSKRVSSTSDILGDNLKNVEKVLNKIKNDFQSTCPRCAGEMISHTIRCGPNRTVKVKKCKICNFWLPIE